MHTEKSTCSGVVKVICFIQKPSDEKHLKLTELFNIKKKVLVKCITMSSYLSYFAVELEVLLKKALGVADGTEIFMLTQSL